jgi:uncharacterized protein (TIGR02611 family)
MLYTTYVAVRRALVFVIGLSVVLVGIVMLVTPGPAVVVIPAGLALLATEFVWARRLLTRLKQTVTRRGGGNGPPPPDAGQERGSDDARS